MRLSQKEVTALCHAFTTILHDIGFKLYLFGSRTDDLKKGGDIDLLLIVEQNLKALVVEKKIEIKNHIFNYIPEQKIDITVATAAELSSDLFLTHIFPSSILLLEHKKSLNRV